MQRPLLSRAALALALTAGIAFADLSPAASAALPDPAAGGPTEVLRYTGDASSATGAALGSGSCDVNGDGSADVVTGAWFWDKTPYSNIGAAYVLLGGNSLTGGSLGDPTSVNAVRIDGPSVASAFVGFAVGCLGDVNGDGLDDIGISHYTAQKAYVVFGREDFTGLTLDSIGDRGFAVAGGPTSGNVGYSMSAVGDLNGDGLDDFGVAEVVADTQGRTNNGRVWVLAGRDDITDVDLTAPAAGEVLLTVDGAISEERIGNIASVGDVNGDGTDDFLLGSYTSTPWGSAVAVPGAAYVVFGGVTGEVDAADLGDDGFAIYGPTRQRDRLGISVAAAGDVDGDGKADLLIGADGVNNATTGPRTGGAAVVFGSDATDTVYTDPTAAPGESVFTCEGLTGTPDTCADPVRRGYWINGIANGDSTGYSVAGIGDVNGDDVPDLALGAYGYDPLDPATQAPMSGAGATFVVFGDPDRTVQELATLDDAAGYRIDGLAAGDRHGRQVASVGDVDANGTTDLAMGGDFAARGGSQNGEVAVALLGPAATVTTLDGPTSGVPGAELTYTATVAPAGGADGVVGAVTFELDGTPIPDCTDLALTDGEATCTATFGVGGAVTATFAGNDQLAASTSTAITLTLTPANTADQAWVHATYEDFLDRTPTLTELASTVGRLESGVSRTVIARELSSSTEWISVSIQRFYQDTLGRPADPTGLAHWTQRVQNGEALASVAARFYASDEYHRKAGATNHAWIGDLYTKVLHRPADPAGLAYWTNRTAAKGRLVVAGELYASAESRRDRVTVLYQSLLARNPDTAGRDHWTERLRTQSDLTLAVHLATSGEYTTRALIRFP